MSWPPMSSPLCTFPQYTQKRAEINPGATLFPQKTQKRSSRFLATAFMSMALALGDGHCAGCFTLIAGLLYANTDVFSPLEVDTAELNAVSYAICGLGSTTGSPAASSYAMSASSPGGGCTLEGPWFLSSCSACLPAMLEMFLLLLLLLPPLPLLARTL